jgi:hypothetical protein
MEGETRQLEPLTIPQMSATLQFKASGLELDLLRVRTSCDRVHLVLTKALMGLLMHLDDCSSGRYE